MKAYSTSFFSSLSPLCFNGVFSSYFHSIMSFALFFYQWCFLGMVAIGALGGFYKMSPVWVGGKSYR